MKKQYIIPTVNVVKVETQAHMLFGSDAGANQLNGGGNRGDYGGSGQLSRGGSWDDED